MVFYPAYVDEYLNKFVRIYESVKTKVNVKLLEQFKLPAGSPSASYTTFSHLAQCSASNPAVILIYWNLQQKLKLLVYHKSIDIQRIYDYIQSMWFSYLITYLSLRIHHHDCNLSQSLSMLFTSCETVFEMSNWHFNEMPLQRIP